MKKNIALITVCNALGNSVVSVMIAVSALTGAMLAADKSLATLPHAFQWLSITVTAIPAGLIFRRFGRRTGFLAGAAIGFVGLWVCVAAVHLGSFWIYVCGTILVGAFISFVFFLRFAAAETASDAFRSTAISLVVGGAIFSAFAGPELAKWTKDWMEPFAFAGAFAAASILPLVMAVLYLFTDFGDVARARHDAPTGRTLAVIARQRDVMIAVLVGMICWGGMVLIMTATPLSMVASGHSFGDTAGVIQWHLVGMFAPSLVTGWLIGRFGVYNVMWAGIALFVASVCVAVTGMTVGHFVGTNLLIGVGWCLMFVASTDLLVRSYRPEERLKVQSFNDFMIFGSVAVCTFLSGYLQNVADWNFINLLILPLILIAALGMIWRRLAKREAVAAE